MQFFWIWAILILSIFEFNHGFNRNITQTTAASSRTCPFSVVADQAQEAALCLPNSSLGAEDFVGSSFTRLALRSDDPSQTGSRDGGAQDSQLGVALRVVQSHEWKACQLLSQLWRQVARSRSRTRQFVQVLVSTPTSTRRSVVSAEAEVSPTQREREEQGQQGQKPQIAETLHTKRGAAATTACSAGACGTSGCPFCCNWTFLDASCSDFASPCSTQCSGGQCTAQLHHPCPVQGPDRLPEAKPEQRDSARGHPAGDEDSPDQGGERAIQRAEPSSQRIAQSSQRATGRFRGKVAVAYAVAQLLVLECYSVAGLHEPVSGTRDSGYDRVAEAQLALQEAKSQLAGSKEIAELAATTTTEGQTVDVDLVSEEDKSKVPDNAQRMQDGMQNLTTTLEQLHHAAEDMLATEQAAKKARLQGQDDVSGMPGATALEPFAQPGSKRPQGAGA